MTPLAVSHRSVSSGCYLENMKWRKCHHFTSLFQFRKHITPSRITTHFSTGIIRRIQTHPKQQLSDQRWIVLTGTRYFCKSYVHNKYVLQYFFYLWRNIIGLIFILNLISIFFNKWINEIEKSWLNKIHHQKNTVLSC